MITTGVVVNVAAYPLGSELVTDAHPGDGILIVDSGTDFVEGTLVAYVDEDTGERDPEDESVLTGGGLIRVGGDDEDAEIVRYSTIIEPDDDDDTDDEGDWGDISSYGIGGGFGGTDEWDRTRHDLVRADQVTDEEDDEVVVGPSTITLAAADPSQQLVHDWPAGTRVDIWDPATGTPAIEWRALCRAASDTDNTDAIDAVIAFPLVSLLPEGSRDEDHAELVTLDDESGDWRVVDVISRVPDATRTQSWISNSTAAISHGQWTGLAGWAIDWDHMPASGWFFTTGMTAGVCSFTQAGLFLVTASATFAAESTAARNLLGIFVNDVEMRRVALPETTLQVTVEVSTVIQANIGDAINIRAWHGGNADSSLAVPDGAPHRWQITRLASAL